jgi:hypothetical protein
MKKDLYLIISLSILVIGIIIYIIINIFNRSPSLNTSTNKSELSQLSACERLGELWKGDTCAKQSEFFTTTDSNITITKLDQLYNINKYYTPLQIYDYMIQQPQNNGLNGNIINLPLIHFFGSIDLTKLKFFTPDMNKGFANFNILLNNIIRKFSIYTLPDLLQTMIIVNLVLHYNNIKDEKSILFFIIYGIFYKTIIEKEDSDMPENQRTNFSVSLTKCLPDNNLILHVYNKTATALKDINCDDIPTVDVIPPRKEGFGSKSSEPPYKISIVNYLIDIQLKFINTINPIHIKEYNNISDAYSAMIQFYINNSTKIDQITNKKIIYTSKTQAAAPAAAADPAAAAAAASADSGEYFDDIIGDIVNNNKTLIKEYIDLIIKYIDAINYVLPNLPQSYGGYTSANREKIINYGNSI